MPDDPKPSPDDNVDPLTWELTRAEREEAQQPQQPRSRTVHTYRPPKASDRVGTFSAVASVLGVLFGRGAGHAMPVVTKLVLLGVALTVVAVAAVTLSQRFGTANDVRKELDAVLAEYRQPILSTAGQLGADAEVRTRFDTVDYAIDPIIETMPTSVRFTAYRDVDKLEMVMGSGTRAQGTVYLDRREFQIKLMTEGSTVGSTVVRLDPAEEPEPADGS